MKKSTTFIFLFAIAFVFVIKLSAQGLSGPESVVYDQQNSRYLISNANGTSIVARDAQGNFTFFVNSGLFFPRGMVIVDNTLYVTDIGKLVGYDLTSKALVVDSIIEGAQGLNDIAYDGAGNLFMSDDLLNKIFVYNVTYGTNTVMIKNGLSAPNGLLYDKDNARLIICSFDGANAAIQGFYMNTSLLKTLAATSLSYLDGLAMDVDKNIYVSSWGDNAVFKFNNDFTQGPDTFSTGHDGPADIYVNPTNNTLVVPNMNSSKLEFFKIVPASVELNAHRDFINVNYASHSTDIVVSYTLEKPALVQMEIVDGMARTVNKLRDENQNAGQYRITLNRDELGIQAGVYILRMYFNGNPVAKRLFFE